MLYCRRTYFSYTSEVMIRKTLMAPCLLIPPTAASKDDHVRPEHCSSGGSRGGFVLFFFSSYITLGWTTQCIDLLSICPESTVICLCQGDKACSVQSNKHHCVMLVIQLKKFLAQTLTDSSTNPLHLHATSALFFSNVGSQITLGGGGSFLRN